MSHKTAPPVSYRETMRGDLTVRHIRERQDLDRVNAIGEIDLYTAPLLRDALADADRREVQNVLVDLARVDFLALAGVRVLQAAGEQRAAAHRRLVISAPTANVQRILSLVGVTGELEIYVSTMSAKSALTQ